jgi:hypothetical protein
MPEESSDSGSESEEELDPFELIMVSAEEVSACSSGGAAGVPIANSGWCQGDIKGAQQARLLWRDLPETDEHAEATKPGISREHDLLEGLPDEGGSALELAQRLRRAEMVEYLTSEQARPHSHGGRRFPH